MFLSQLLLLLLLCSAHSHFPGRNTKLAATLARLRGSLTNPHGPPGTRNKRSEVTATRNKRSEVNSTFPEEELSYDYDESYYAKYYVGPVCTSIFISITDKNFKDLENCEVVDGHVWIYFINDLSLKYDLTHSNYSFPKLRVITQYLLLYRVLGLPSLRNLFPNLGMIRGQSLFYDKYAIVIYESLQLANIGLDNLRHIKNGGVRLQKNPKLCYTSTVDWGRLGEYSGNAEIGRPEIIGNNVGGCINQCGNTEEACVSVGDDGVRIPYCWGLNLCQKEVCPSNCSHACSDTGQCTCHPQCMAGCSRPNDPTACFACRNFYFNGTCEEKCPGETLQKHDWLCVSKEECNSDRWIVHNGQCLYDCPIGHNLQETDDQIFYCELCKGGVCQNVCDHFDSASYVVDSVEKLDDLQGCTSLPLQLVITITRGSDMVRKLEEVLGGLQEVGALVVKRSFALVSLSFLKNLRRISGERAFLVDDTYSVFIWDNQNLRDLWNFRAEDGRSNLTIGGGKAFFHYNQYLCLDKIDPIRNLTRELEDEKDISRLTNGDRTPCQMEELSVEVTVKRGGVRLTWGNPVVKDYRTLIGFQVFFMESPKENATRYHGADACGRTSWLTKYVEKPPEPPEGVVSHSSELLVGLRAYTKHAYYVVMSTTMTAKKAAQSNISYFTTAPGPPTKPQDVVATATNYSAIAVAWQPPQFPNGNISHYVVRWQRQPADGDDMINKVDNCIEGQTPVRKMPAPEPEKPEPPATDDDSECCSCDGGATNGHQQSSSEIVESQTFEDFIINKLIISRDLDSDDSFTSRRKRSTKSAKSFNRYKRAANNATSDNATSPAVEPESSKFAAEERVVYGNNITLTGLHHYSEYSIEVSACNHAYRQVHCGYAASAFKRTKVLATADVIPEGSLRIVSKGDERVISFLPPRDPNGFIKKYKIQQFGADKSSKIPDKCCSVMSFHQLGFCSLETQFLLPGKYQVRVQPVSVAAPGLWTRKVTFNVGSQGGGGQPPLVLVLVAVLLSFLAVAVIVLFVFYKKRYLSAKKPQIYASVNPEYSSIAIYEPDEYEVPASHIELLEEIGQGHFGKVFKGVATEVVKGEKQTNVAVKTLHGNESLAKRMEFLKEASVMKVFNSHHVVRLLGVVSLTNRPMVVMEFMARGDLKSYLRGTRPDAEVKRGEAPTLGAKLQMCGEVADGMAYLADSKYVHRDLAARNCLVAADMTVKIGDFGLTRDVYETDYYRIDTKGILPVRWMAPESLKDGVFDSRSDVWSFGIVLWEVATLAEQPYQGLQHDQVTRFVIDGGYMEQPKECPKKLYDLMLMCWHYSPAMRPTFSEIISSLAPDLSDHFKQVSYFHEAQPDDDDAGEGDGFLAEGEAPGLATAEVHPKELPRSNGVNGGSPTVCSL